MQRLTQPQPAAQTAAPASVQPDLKVLGWLLGWAKKSAASQDPSSTGEWLKQSNRVARAVLAELPAQSVAVDLERAITAVSAQTPDTAAAGAALGAAVDLLAQTPDQTLVPADVAARLKALKDQVASDPAKSMDELNALLVICGQDKPSTCAYQIGKCLDDAGDAIGREAWPVVTAEIEQAETLMKKIGDAAAGTAAVGTAPPAAGTGTGSEAGTAPASGVSAPAAGSAASGAGAKAPATAPASTPAAGGLAAKAKGK
jgi:hypothetical protein